MVEQRMYPDIIVIAKSYYKDQAFPELSPTQLLSAHWITIIVPCIHASFAPVEKFLCVQKAVPVIALSIGNVHINEEFTVCFVRENDADYQSDQLRSYFDTNCGSAAFGILRGKLSHSLYKTTTSSL